MPKKILLISFSARQGHLRAADAIKETAELYFPELQIEHIDMADFCHPLLRLNVVSNYHALLKYAPWLYGFIYKLTDTGFYSKALAKIEPLISWSAKETLQKINEFQPDTIICTHFLPPYFIIPQTNIPVDVVITDYYASKIWLAPGVRNFVVGNKEVQESLSNLGIKSIASGIPVSPVFYQNKNACELKAKYKIPENAPTILFMPTIRGRVDIKKTIKKIIETIYPINLVIIADKEKLPKSSLVIKKHTNEVDEYMRIADLIVTKAGGLTITECLALKKPIIIVNAIPGQEDGNAEYLVKNNFAKLAKSSSELVDFIQNFTKNNLHFSIPPDKSPAAKIILEKMLE